MTHVDDLDEVNDREPMEPEPCEWYPAPKLVDLEEVEELIAKRDVVHADVDEQRETERRLLDEILPAMAAELKAARERIAEFEALEKREEWAVALGGSVPPTGPIQDGDYGEAALDLARKHKGQAWRRKLTVHPWEAISSEPPF
ncbi:hypothetical protein ABZ897_00445 [Nonomuraea sp. NPDC046802]|uniref:hypothetical protein n=1 Tax=Nonomuraea sp. NPDC046802 TaxID=3154919 RepID=UPI0033E8856E